MSRRPAIAALLVGLGLVGSACAPSREREDVTGLLEEVRPQPSEARQYLIPTADGGTRLVTVDAAAWQSAVGMPIALDDKGVLAPVLTRLEATLRRFDDASTRNDGDEIARVRVELADIAEALRRLESGSRVAAPVADLPVREFGQKGTP